MDQALATSFANTYTFCAVIAAVGLVLRFFRRMTEGERLTSLLLMAPLVVMYFVGMHRIAGEDFDNYFRAYYELDTLVIPDPGYTALTTVMRAVGIDFSTFLFLIGVFTVSVMWKAAHRFHADPTVVVVAYLLHLAIGRDLSQMRIGLAVAIYFLGQMQSRRWLKLLLYIAAASVHITVLVMVVVWIYACKTQNLRGARRWFWIYLPLGGFAVLGSALLQVAALVDPRVEIYLAWDEDMFGAPLSSYSTLARTVVVLAIYAAATRRFKHLNMQRWITMELAGAAIVLGFSQFAIFASRLSNVAVSMYPFGLGVVALAYQSLPMRRRSLVPGAMLKASLAATLLVLLVRPASYEALEKVVPSMYSAARDLP